MRSGWARFALERYEKLKRWREYAEIIARACAEVLGRDCLRVYVVGGAAEGRLTVLSDIDVVVVVGDPSRRSVDTALSVRRRAEQLGLPDDLPVDLKVMTVDEFQRLRSRGVYKKVVEVGPRRG